MAVTIKVCRPPIILCHGLWSNSTTWKDARKDVGFRTMIEGVKLPEYPKGLVSAPDLGAYGNHASLAENMPRVEEIIAASLTRLREVGLAGPGSTMWKFATTQVDWVGHSMGGLLPRYYYRWKANSKQWKRRDNFGGGDIHKLIFMNAPMRGARLANLLNQVHVTHPDLDPIMESALESPHGGALIDIAEESSAFKYMGSTPIPSHGIVGTGCEKMAYWSWFAKSGSAKLRMKHRKSKARLRAPS